MTHTLTDSSQHLRPRMTTVCRLEKIHPKTASLQPCNVMLLLLILLHKVLNFYYCKFTKMQPRFLLVTGVGAGNRANHETSVADSQSTAGGRGIAAWLRPSRSAGYCVHRVALNAAPIHAFHNPATTRHKQHTELHVFAQTLAHTSECRSTPST